MQSHSLAFHVIVWVHGSIPELQHTVLIPNSEAAVTVHYCLAMGRSDVCGPSVELEDCGG